ncbi:unnamed protein product [Ambrosiozyma monospora]|uniref:Unnamed protein product n=1 Tax=Ambrosiozyma monospora TaxID=43982 RepID=A0ACB5TAE2_AMBMO|nr:unnamed protein product [Ambrosiozyma monospora]
MFKFASGGLSNLHPNLYDIRVQSPVKNCVIVKGSPEEASSVLLSGHVVFAIPEKITLKQIKLNLSGTYKLEFIEYLNSSQNATKVVKQEVPIMKCDWDNLLTSPEGFISQGTAQHNQRFPLHPELQTLLPSHSSGSIKTLNTLNKNKGKPITVEYSREEIPTGTTPFPKYKHQEQQVRFVLPAGNYSLPFQVVIPGNIPETIEGLKCGAVLYRFQSEMIGEKATKSHPKSTKYLRVLRLPLPTDDALVEDCSMENCWPQKAEYEVRIPRKMVPIGGICKVHILIIPLLKGLSLGKISASISQYFILKSGTKGDMFEDEKTIYKCDLPQVDMQSLRQDRWSLTAKLFIPKKFKQCSPDAVIREDMLIIRHKLNLSVELVNPDGHVSLINSKLPMVLYVSGRDQILGRNAYIDNQGKVRFMKGDVPIFDSSMVAPSKADSTTAVPPSSPPSLDTHDPIATATSAANATSNPTTPGVETGEKHKHRHKVFAFIQ